MAGHEGQRGAALALGAAAVLVLGGVTGQAVLTVAVLVVQALMAVVWFGALGAVGGPVGRVVVLGAALTADLVVLRSDDSRPMEHVAPVLAVALLASLGQQLVRRDGRGELTTSLTATGSATVVAGLGSAWLAVDVSQDGTALLVLAAVAAALAPVSDLLVVWVPRWVAALVAFAATGAVALAVATRTDAGTGVLLCTAAAAAVTARLGVVTANRVPTPTPVLLAALPALLVAPATYVVARVLLG